MNKKISLGAAIAFALIVATATFVMTMVYGSARFEATMNDLQDRKTMFDKLANIDQIVRENYYASIEPSTLADSLAKGYMEGLGDPYSRYIDARTYERLTRADEGSVVGIGAEITANSDGYLQVVQIYADSPAAAVGMEVDDIIVQVDGTDINLENSAQMLESIQGEPGTRIDLVVRRGTEEFVMDGLTRRAVTIPSVHARVLEESNVGYILIDEFNAGTSEQFNREIQRLLGAQVGSIIIDLRDNPGGELRWAARILDTLLPTGVIASTTNRDGSTDILYTSDANELDIPTVVLMNENTASAAELFAQALKDYNRASLVGTVTAGKGIIQEIIQLSDGSALELTMGILNAPSGETFNGVGVRPDYEASQEGEWKNLDETTDAQLIKAVEVAVALHRVSETQAEGGEQDPPESVDPTGEGGEQSSDSSEASESSEESGEASDSSQESSDQSEDSSEGESSQSSDGEESGDESSGGDDESSGEE